VEPVGSGVRVLHLLASVLPGNNRWAAGDYATVEISRLALHATGTVRFDDESRLCFASVEPYVMNVILVRPMFTQTAVVGHAAEWRIGRWPGVLQQMYAFKSCLF
jgi:hypothetical protein